MFDTAAIFRTAHATVRKVVAQGRTKATYRQLFAMHLRFAWNAAKGAAYRAAREALDATAARVAELRDAIVSEECRERMDFAKVRAMRAELSQLRAA